MGSAVGHFRCFVSIAASLAVAAPRPPSIRRVAFIEKFQRNHKALIPSEIEGFVGYAKQCDAAEDNLSGNSCGESAIAAYLGTQHGSAVLHREPSASDARDENIVSQSRPCCAFTTRFYWFTALRISYWSGTPKLMGVPKTIKRV